MPQVARTHSAKRNSEQEKKSENLRSIIREARDLSTRHDCAVVTYFLELAYSEASDFIQTIRAEAEADDSPATY
jgi:hypothetical protein